MSDIEITFTDEPSDDDRATIIGGLVAYNNASAATRADHRELAVVAWSGGRVIGGLLGHTNWNWLFIRQLWIAEEHRGGTGRRLMLAAEEEAVRRGCSHAHCDTFDFQALPFYQKLGYEVFGQLDDYPPGHSRFFLQKRDLSRG